MTVPPALSTPDTYHLSSAQGWLGLGNRREAVAELNLISRPMRGHPDVLEVRCHLCVLSGKWSEALTASRSITQQAPERASGWIFQSETLKELGRVQEAYELLFDVLPRFPKNALLRYSMACFACRLGRFFEAGIWLRKAMDLSDANQLMAAALEDPDLLPMWTELGVAKK